MRKFTLSALLSASILAGCGTTGPTNLNAASKAPENFYSSMGLSSDGTLHKGASDMFGNAEFGQADSDKDGRLTKTEMESFFKAQDTSALKAANFSADPASSAALGIGGVALAGYYAFVGARLSSQIMHPAKAAASPGMGAGLVSDELNLAFTYTPATSATTKAIVLCHGLGSSKEAMSEYASFLKDYNVLAFDFRNHGASEGKATTGGVAESHDVLAAVNYLKAQGNTRIGVLGVGMGAVAALSAAANSKDISAVVADGAYASLNDQFTYLAKQKRYPLATGCARAATLMLSLRTRTSVGKGDALQSLSKLNAIPVCYVQGGADKTVLGSSVQTLFEADTRSAKQLLKVDGADLFGSHRVEPQRYESTVISVFQFAMR